MNQRSTRPKVASTPSQQLPLRGPGLNVHSAHEQADQQHDLRAEQRAALRERVKNYPSLQIEPPYTRENIGAQCARWSNRHPVTRNQNDRELMSAYKFCAAENRYIKEKYNKFICNPTQKFLMKKLGISESDLRRRTKRFVAYGALKVRRQLNEETGRSMNFYVFPG